MSISPDVNGGHRFTQNSGQTVDVVRHPKPSAPNLKERKERLFLRHRGRAEGESQNISSRPCEIQEKQGKLISGKEGTLHAVVQEWDALGSGQLYRLSGVRLTIDQTMFNEPPGLKPHQVLFRV